MRALAAGSLAAILLGGCDDRALRPIEAACDSTASPAARPPVDLMFLVDVGPDIQLPFEGGSESKFVETRKALFSFVLDRRSAGVGAGLQVYPASAPGCDPSAFAAPLVAVSDLPDGANAFLTALEHAGTTAGSSSPLTVAVEGTLAHLRARTQAPGARPVALVLITQARQAQQQCSPDDPIGAAGLLAQAADWTPPVPSYVIGVLSAADRQSSRGALGVLAAAGGAHAPFIIDEAANAGHRLQEALETVRDLAAGCAPAESN